MVASKRKKTAKMQNRKKITPSAMKIMEIGDEFPSQNNLPLNPKSSPKVNRKTKKTKNIDNKTSEKQNIQTKPSTYTFGFGDGEKTIIAINENDILEISDIGAPSYSLADWNIIISKTEIIPLAEKTGKTIDFPKGMTRGTLLSEDGFRADFCNVEKITIPENQQQNNTEKNHLFLMGNLGPKGDAAWGLVVTGCRVVNLAKFDNFSLKLLPDEIAVLTGPQGNILHLANFSEIKIPNLNNIKTEFQNYNLKEILLETNSITPEKQELFYFSANDENAEFIGTPLRSVIRIETSSTYGWNVNFENGLIMSLSDVKEFQSRHGRLPDTAGIISHGDKTLKFTGTTEILVYEPPSYSSFDLA